MKNLNAFLEKTKPIFQALEGLEFFIAGGCIRDYFNDEQPKDFDIFFKNDADSRIAAERLGEASDKEIATVIELGDLTLNVIHKRNFDRAYDVVHGFDFFCVCACVDNLGELHVHPNFHKDRSDKVLRVCNITTPFSTFERVARFSKRGYSIDKAELKKVAKEVQENSELDYDAY